MARDAAKTREQLLRAGERLFARHGVNGVSVREITELAQQRNASAIHYHFGSRDGLLRAISDKHLEPQNRERSAMLDRLEADGRASDVRALVETIVVPMTHGLATPDGRDYLRIVPQLLEHAGVRAIRSGKGAPEYTRNLDLISDCLAHAGLPEAVRRERIATVLTMITGALGDRARDLERGRTVLLDDDMFVANLIDMAVAALTVPAAAHPQPRETGHGVRAVRSGVPARSRRARSRP
jgi:AcrR family transcriptional regulator